MGTELLDKDGIYLKRICIGNKKIGYRLIIDKEFTPIELIKLTRKIRQLLLKDIDFFAKRNLK